MQDPVMVSKPRLTVYHRVGCHLCEQVTARLLELQSELAFDFDLVDIDRDPQLHARYDVDVPVVALGETVLCYHFLDEAILRQSLQSVLSSRSE